MDRKKARELLIKSRMYKYVAWLCAAIGFLVFIGLYQAKYDGNIVNAIGDPAFIALILVPFIPAVIMLRISGKAEKQLAEALGDQGSETKNA